MAANSSFLFCLLTGLAGYPLEILSEKLLEPQALKRQPWQSRCLQFSLFELLYCLLAFLTRRPICSICFSLAFILILIFVNNAKYRSMREPFLFQDYDYFLDTIRFPRLFLPFLGLRAFCLCALAVFIAIFALWLESPMPHFWQLDGQFGALLLLSSSSLFLFWLAKSHRPGLSLSPERDMRELGFLAFLAFYGLAWPRKDFPAAKIPHWTGVNPERFPHLLAIQSESFFDARRCWPDIHQSVYKPLEQFMAQSFLHGDLLVPALGANTERSEFAFLSGISPAELGIIRFNPYRLLARGWNIPALPAFLRSLGYQTICIHPFLRSFYGRDKIFSRLGFDKFIDITAFGEQDRFGPYIGDLALGRKILETQRSSHKPTFIFAISMENHGPLNLEDAPDENALKELFAQNAPDNCVELPVYLRHARNAGQMLLELKEGWERARLEVSLCFYGDHVPIMPQTWKTLGFPPVTVPYFCWNSSQPLREGPSLLACHQLAAAWLNRLNELPRPQAAQYWKKHCQERK